MRRSALAMFALLLLVLALPAVASAPSITVTPFYPFVVQSQADGGNGCPSFDVLIAAQQGRPIRAKTITFANGSTVSSGAVFATATNQTNSKSINLNISGPGQFSVSDNTTTLFGPQLLVGFQNFGPAALPSIAFVKGTTVLQQDTFGFFTSVSYTGAPPEDICQALE